MNYAAVAEKANRYVQKGQVDKAVGLWNNYLPNAGDNEAANALNNLGDLCARKKNTVQAIDYYLKASHAFEQAGFPLKAIATLKKTLKLDPDRTEVFLRLGDLNARRDMIGNAVEAYLHVCRLMVAEGEHDQALQMVQKVCVLDPVNTRHRLQMAAELFELGFTDQAITETVNAIDLFLEGGNLEEAERYCRHLLDLQPGCEAAQERLERIAHWGEPDAAHGDPAASTEDTPIDELFAALDMVGDGPEAPEATVDAVPEPPAPASDRGEPDIAPDADASPEVGETEEPAFGELTLDLAPPDDAADLSAVLEPQGGPPDTEEDQASGASDDAGTPEFELEGTAIDVDPEAEPEAEPEPEPPAGADWTLEAPTEPVPAPLDPATDADADFMSISLADVSLAAAEATSDIDLGDAAPQESAADAPGDAPEDSPEAAPFTLEPEGAPEAETPADDAELDLSSLDLTARFRASAPTAPEPDPEPVREAAPPEAPAPPVDHAPPAPAAPGGFQVREALTEAHFYEREGLTEEAVKLYRTILSHAPGHPEATARLEAMGHPATPAPSATPVMPAAPAPPAGGGSDEFSNFTAEIEETIEKEVAGSWRRVGEEAQFDEILDAFRKGVEEEVSEDDAETHYDLGIAYHEMGLTEEAIGEFQRAIKGASRFADATIMLARCFGEVGKERLAVTRLREAVARPDCGGDQWISLAYELATVLESTGETEEARRMYEEVYARDITYRDVARRVANLG